MAPPELPPASPWGPGQLLQTGPGPLVRWLGLTTVRRPLHCAALRASARPQGWGLSLRKERCFQPTQVSGERGNAAVCDCTRHLGCVKV